MAFDPKSYVGETKEEDEFDPKSYLGVTEMAPSAVEDKTGESIYGMAAPAITGAAYASPTGLRPIIGQAAGAAGQGLKAMSNRPIWQTASDIAGIATHGVPWGTIAQTALSPGSAAQTIAQTAEIAKAAPGYAARAAGPILHGAARVAGPAGLAYDIYQALPYMAQGGQELQSGRAAQRMRAARQSMLNAPTPAPLSPGEAENLLMSGDTRMIGIYGGEDKLREIIRRKAAERVMGPVAPGSF